MFCDKPHVNRLTALLIAHGITDIVLCPGSRNGVMAHNFATHPAFSVFPVTDERSAAFVALGMTLATARPAAVCVTSGSALLNTLPAVAEASFRHAPLLVISADRPPEWIGKLDGQTLPQPDALMPYAETFNASETDDGTIINTALSALLDEGGKPIHLNVPISEPLFSFTTARLPEVTPHKAQQPSHQNPISSDILELIANARLPLLVAGQMDRGAKISDIVSRLDDNCRLLAMPEVVSNLPQAWRTTWLEATPEAFSLQPDVVIHIGGNMVNKRMKQLLRSHIPCRVVRIQPDSGSPDTFGKLFATVQGDERSALKQLGDCLPYNVKVKEEKEQFNRLWNNRKTFCPNSFSDLGVMQQISQTIAHDPGITLHVANSSVIRNACHFFAEGRHALFCNRGVNGIEGSLSVAAGCSLKDPGISLALIGDLSFFYDNNALWNAELGGNLRIVLFNNGGGQIFRRLPGLDKTPARDRYVAGCHSFRAKGICEAYGVEYLSAASHGELTDALRLLLHGESQRPVLLEVFTRADDNEAARHELNNHYRKSI